METVKTISYDHEAAGRRVVTIPSALPFGDHYEGLTKVRDYERRVRSLSSIAEEKNIYKRSVALSQHLAISDYPHLDLLTVLSMAGSSEMSGIRLLYASMLAVKPAAVLVEKMAGFPNVRRMMGRITRKKAAHAELSESEDWFARKVMLLSMSKKLPGASDQDPERPWLNWGEGVRRALAEADDRWDEALSERAKAEVDALDMKIRGIVAALDPERRSSLSIYLGSLSEENSFTRAAVSELAEDGRSDPLIIRRGLADQWDSLISGLRESEAGELMATMFEAQAAKAHTHPQLRAGASLIRSLNMHPEINRSKRNVDLPSALHDYVINAGDGIIEAMVPKGTRLDAINGSSGFDLEGEVLTVDLARISRGTFVDDEGMPVDVDWTLATLDKELSYKSLVLCYMDNDSFLVELLNNPKAISKPGIVELISARCRSLRVLTLVATRRDLFTGFTNKNVPLNLLMSPSKIPLTLLRKFIHVRYVDKMTLQRLIGRGGNIREEVRREIRRYLDSAH
jgi:hypothetical protein